MLLNNENPFINVAIFNGVIIGVIVESMAITIITVIFSINSSNYHHYIAFKGILLDFRKLNLKELVSIHHFNYLEIHYKYLFVLLDFGFRKLMKNLVVH